MDKSVAFSQTVKGGLWLKNRRKTELAFIDSYLAKVLIEELQKLLPKEESKGDKL